MAVLTILHTNDFHGKLTSHGAEIIAREKESSGPCLLLDCGDAVSSGNIYYRPGGEPILAQMSDLHYDAMVMGNREFHFLSTGLRSKVKLARFPVLCANICSKAGDVGPTVVPSMVFDIAGLRVGVFGLTVPMITKKMLASKVSPYWFADPIDTARELVAALRPQVDVLVALTHIGLQKDQELAGEISGIDLVVGGHTHAVLQEPRLVGRTAIVQAGWWGHYLGKVAYSPPSSSGGMPELRGELIDLRE